MKSECSIFFHNYYGNQDRWLEFFLRKISVPSNLYYNKVDESIYNMERQGDKYRQKYMPDTTNMIRKIIYRQSANKGKDIGGKLILLDAYQKLDFKTEYGLFLHDKKSLYKANNTDWTNNLLQIADSDFCTKAIQIFLGHPEVGIITSTGNIENEFSSNLRSFKSNNKMLLPQLQKRFNIFPASFQYAAGTMFWFRMQPVNTFFNANPPLQIRTSLEIGNITDEDMGSNTHCWERLLSWIITAQGYKIKTI